MTSASRTVSAGGTWRLVHRRPAVVLAAFALAVAASGCVSTEQKAAWAHVTDARIIASQNPTVVRHAGSQARVARVALIRAGGQVAIAVQLQNVTRHALSDLPISVGLSHRGVRLLLNRAAGLDYFKTHVAVIPAAGAVTWVFTARARRRVTGKPFATVGSESHPPLTVPRTIPAIAAVLAPAAGAPGTALRVRVSNRSSVPQSQLQVYAIASSAGGYAAAGSATIADLAGGDSTVTTIRLVGRPAGARVQLEALPTLF